MLINKSKINYIFYLDAYFIISMLVNLFFTIKYWINRKNIILNKNIHKHIAVFFKVYRVFCGVTFFKIAIILFSIRLSYDKIVLNSLKGVVN